MTLRHIFVLAAVFSACGAVELAAQGTAKPFAKRALSQEEYARAIETNDTSILYISSHSIAAAAFEVYGRAFSTQELADWIRELDVRECPRQTVRLARIFTVPTRRVDTEGWRRMLRPGEMCLYADNVPVISLDCANFIHQAIPLGRITAEVTPIGERARYWDVVPQYVPPRPPIIKEEPGWWRRNWEYPVIGAAAAVVACVIWCRVEASASSESGSSSSSN